MNTVDPSGEQPKKKRSFLWIGVPICLFLVAMGAAALAYFLVPEKKPPVEKAPVAEEEEELILAHDKTTVLIMGIDERTEDVGRSDTLMLAMLDPEEDRASLLSIPRDTRVRIKGHGFDKINAAYAYGKVPLAEKTVEEFLGVTVNHYLIIDTKAFVKVIDAIGGVDVNVEERMYYEDPWDDDGGLLIDFQPGLQHMDGRKAITYVRYRDAEGDAGRIRRQQAFMRACMAKLVSPSVLASLPTVVQEIFSSVRTDITLTDLLALAGSLKKAADKQELVVGTVPGEYEYLGGICYLLPDVQKMRKTVASTLGIQLTEDVLERFERTAQDYEESLPPPAAREPAPIVHDDWEETPRSRRAPEPKPEPEATKDPPKAKESAPADPPKKELPKVEQEAPIPPKEPASPSPSKESSSTPGGESIPSAPNPNNGSDMQGGEHT